MQSIDKQSVTPGRIDLRHHAAGMWRLSAAVFGAVFGLSLVFLHAQDVQFRFDRGGNLFSQSTAVTTLPQILAQPHNRIVGPGESASFSVVVMDTRALSYQWQFNGTNIAGATNDTVLLRNVGTSNEGEYRVVLTNPSGSVTSAPAMLWIDSDADGLPDSWERANFGGLSQNATADFDGDGVSNLREFLDDTSPTNRAAARFQLTVLADGDGLVELNPRRASYTNGETVTLTATPSGTNLFYGWSGDIQSSNNPVLLTMTSNRTVRANFQFLPLEIVWTNTAGGDWHSATNWSPNRVPGATDHAKLLVTATVTVNNAAECQRLTMGGVSGNPTLTGNGTLTVRENFLWAFGTLGGNGRTILGSNATLNISGFVSLAARTLENRGMIQVYGAGGLSLTGGAVVTNCAEGLFIAVSETPTLGGGSANGRFDNAGTFRKFPGTGTLTLNSGLIFNNSGIVDLQTGTLLCNGSFNNAGAVNLSAGTTQRLTGGGSATGTFTVPSSALVEWTDGTFTLGDGAQLGGGGLYRIASRATLTASAIVSVANLDMVAGTLDGTGTLTIANIMDWTGGTMSGNGRTLIPAGATLNLGGGSLNTRTLENAGTVLWTGAGNLGMNFGSVITNRAGALFHVQNAATLSSGAGANRFDNAGTFRKSTSAGTTILNNIFNNVGTVEIQTGTLQCNGFFTNNGAVNLSAGTTNRLVGGGSASGTFNTPASALVEWTGGTFTLNPGAQLSGAGLYRINGVSAAVLGNGDVTVQNLDLANNTLSGTGILTVANTMNWTGGTMEGSGRTLISAAATLQLGSVSGISLKRTLENGGTAVWTGSGAMILLNGILTNRPGALFDVQNAGRFFAAGGTCRFDNNGTYRKSVSTGTNTVESGMSFNNSGTLDIRSGIIQANGNYISASNTLLNCALDGTVAGTTYGQLRVAGTVTLNGALSVNLLPGFTPATNDVFTVVTAGARSGAFTSFAYPANRVTMSLSNTPTSVVLRVTNVFPVPQPVLLTPEVAGSDVRLIWTATSNFTYRLEFNPVVSPTNWTPLPGDVTTLSNTASKLDPLTSSNRLYRVRVLP